MLIEKNVSYTPWMKQLNITYVVLFIVIIAVVVMTATESDLIHYTRGEVTSTPI